MYFEDNGNTKAHRAKLLPEYKCFLKKKKNFNSEEVRDPF